MVNGQDLSVNKYQGSKYTLSIVQKHSKQSNRAEIIENVLWWDSLILQTFNNENLFQLKRK